MGAGIVLPNGQQQVGIKQEWVQNNLATPQSFQQPLQKGGEVILLTYGGLSVVETIAAQCLGPILAGGGIIPSDAAALAIDAATALLALTRPTPEPDESTFPTNHEE